MSNEIQYLFLGFVGGIFVFWLYLKFLLRNYNKSLANLIKESIEEVKVEKTKLKEALREYGDPDQSLH